MGNTPISNYCKMKNNLDQGELEQINTIKSKTEHEENYQHRALNHNPLRNKEMSKPVFSYAVEVQSHNSLTNAAQQTLSRLNKIHIPNVTDFKIYKIKQRQSTYQGQFKNKIPNGKGVTIFKNGSYFAGQFLLGEASQKGVYIYPNGYIYIGQFKDSQFNGSGTLAAHDNNFIYSGSFMLGLPHGKGTQEIIDTRTQQKSKYKGHFKNGQKNGFGRYYWPNGQRYEGFFKDGRMHGKGTIYSPNNQILYDGNFRNGLKTGYGIFIVKNGSFEGQFHEDKINGNGTFVWKDGKVYEGTFLKSQMSGDGIIYYPNGQKSEGSWQRNHNTGLLHLEYDPQAVSKISEIKKRHENNLRQTVSKFNETHFDNDQFSDSEYEIDSPNIRQNKWEKHEQTEKNLTGHI